MKSKRILCAALALLMLLALTGCGDTLSYKVRSVVTLVEQEYSLAFRNDDPLRDYVVAAIEELSRKWFGREAVSFGKKEGALSELEAPAPHTLLLGVDIGGLGTPIASLASLISLKLYSRSRDAHTGRYLLTFTLVNVALLAILSAARLIL